LTRPSFDTDADNAYVTVILMMVLLMALMVKGFPYSLPIVGPGADPSVQAVSPQVT